MHTSADKKRRYAEDPVCAAASRARVNARRTRAKAQAVAELAAKMVYPGESGGFCTWDAP